MSKEQKALLRFKAQDPDKIKSCSPSYLFSHLLPRASFISCILCFIFILPIHICLAEENQDKPDAETQKVKVSKTVSINAGPDGKVIWLFHKSMGIAHGSAIVQYEDVVLKADHVWADMKNEIVEAEGNVSLEMKDQIVTAKHLIFDLKSKKGMMKDGISFDDPWYNSGKKMSRFNEEDSFIEKGSMTSCSLTHPHYSFEASNIVIHLKKELIAKHVIFKVGGIPLLYLPVYRRSLEPEKRSRFIFKIGSNTFEGYFVKNILPIRWRMIDGSIFLNYTTRRGTSGGIEFDYDADKVKFREIFIPVPEDASNEDWREARDKMDEILKEAKGELDRIWLRQIFIKFQISQEDKAKAREKAAEILADAKGEDADFAQLARSWSNYDDTKGRGGYVGSLDSFVVDDAEIKRKEGEELVSLDPGLYPVIKTALALESGQVSDLVETEAGYHIVKTEPVEGQSPRIRHIFIEFEPSRAAQETAQNRADEILTKLATGETFEKMARLYSDDPETRDKGGDLGWEMFQDLDMSFHNVVRNLEKGEISRPITTDLGVYILKLEDKDKTPDFASLSQKYSQSPSAEMGGDVGHKSKWELEPSVRREAFRLEIEGISKPIKTEEGYKIIKVEKKRRLLGDVYVNYGDLYSYQIEKNPIKLGQTWDVDIHHSQTLWRAERQEYDPGVRQQRLNMWKELALQAELSLAGEEYKQVYQGYRPERELRSYCALDYRWTSRVGASGRARLIVDGTRDLLGGETTLIQRYPEVKFWSPNYRLYELKPFKHINSGLKFISDRIQGKDIFANSAKRFSDDITTKEKGGDLGWFSKGEGKLHTKVESIVFDPNEISPGDISDPISVENGYYIVKLEEVEEKLGRRERVRVRQIFISSDPDIRTADEASKWADVIYRNLVEGDYPSLGFPTLDNTTFSFDISAGNYFREEYRREKDIWLQTADASLSINKRAIIRIGLYRELNLDLTGDFHQIWHSKTQTLEDSLGFGVEVDPTVDLTRRDRNVFSNVWNAEARLSTDLHRIYRSVPGISAMKHTVSPYVRFEYAPPSESEVRSEELEPKLYPFGASAWMFERKDLSVGITNRIDIKTKRKREQLSLFRWTLSGGANFTEEEGSDRRYNYINNTLTLMPHKQVNIGTVLTLDPNGIGTENPFLWSLSNDIRYSDAKRRWTAHLSRRYTNPRGGKKQQFFSGNVNLRWSRTWSLRCELQYEYDERVKDIYLMRFSLHRMLHCWESQIVFSRRGTKGGIIRRDFYVQLDILADPGKALGIGYDQADESWKLRSLPGMGRFGGFLRPGSSMYY
jgi:parvulin-like peptidyl-prolyl isomerase